MRWAIGFLFCSYFSTSKASPNDEEIVIVIIIIVDEAEQGLHSDGIIAQRNYFGSIFFFEKITIPLRMQKQCPGRLYEKVKSVEGLVVDEPVWFVELQGPAKPGGRIGAGAAGSERRASTVRGEMSCQSVDRKKASSPLTNPMRKSLFIACIPMGDRDVRWM